ncbi:lipase 2 [Microdochium trichocladiopsis]|uniref:Lipase 2 n=1 Tax=Microdochium trichocladiopsis TaxID=1682393 RepID=A0A9P8YA26_9PEZI|nr:lipase 2 [Microdochium trichocladiopsis]KAH7033456.1 lipase 2 [Microdochium trichocladiopsis]
MAPRTRDELLAYGSMDPVMAQTLATNPMRAPEPSDPYYGRNDFLAVRAHSAQILKEKHGQRYIPGPIPEQVHEEDRKIPMRDGSEINVRIYRPVTSESITRPETKCPLIVMFHEGGFFLGDYTDQEVNCRLFARDLQAVCVNVEYRLAPENQFPIWIDDSWDTLQWAASNAGTLGADASAGFIIGGVSAGGNIAAVLAHLARDRGLSPPLTGQYLSVPPITMYLEPSEMPAQYRDEYLGHPDITPNQDPVLSSQVGSEARAKYQTLLNTNYESPLQVPFLFRTQPGGHKGVPPAYFQICGLDPLRDEGLIYERVLREEAGVATRVDVYGGYGHCFWSMWPDLPPEPRVCTRHCQGDGVVAGSVQVT